MTEGMWWILAGLFVMTIAFLAIVILGTHLYVRIKFLDRIMRIFEEKPLFIIPRGQPVEDSEDITFRTPDGLNLKACYLHCYGTRKGVVLFCPEFGSNRWSCVAYCEKLREAGYDVFAYESRNQGDSDHDAQYQPLQWITDKDITDVQAALDHLKSRPDIDPRGIGVFGISKGGGLALWLAANDPSIRCAFTDSAYATYLTVVPFMRRFVTIYSPHKRIQAYAPDCFYGWIGLVAINKVARKRNVRFQWIESAVKRIHIPVFMIHGEADSYIQPAMSKALFDRVRAPEKQYWLVPKAKHNQAPIVAGEEYHRRLVDFFHDHLGDIPADRTPMIQVRATKSRKVKAISVVPTLRD